MVWKQLQRKLGLTRHVASIRDLESNSPDLKTLAPTKDPVDDLCLGPSRHLKRRFDSVTGGVDVGRYDLWDGTGKQPASVIKKREERGGEDQS